MSYLPNHDAAAAVRDPGVAHARQPITVVQLAVSRTVTGGDGWCRARGELGAIAMRWNRIRAIMRTVIAIHQVRKSFDDTAVLGPLDLQLAAGVTTVVIGPSGCGKSTLMRVVNGLVRPDQGTLSIFGETVHQGSDWRALRLRMGYVIQEGGLFPHLTARQNVTLMPRRLGWDHHRIAQRLSELTEMTRLSGDVLERFPAELSGGQRQRVSLMRALILEPELLLLDEPLAALDPMIRHHLQRDLKALFSGPRLGVLMVTHDLYEARFFGDETVLMDAGRIVQRGPFQELLHRPASEFVRTFIEAQRRDFDV